MDTAERWWLYKRELPDGRLLFVVPLTFGRVRLTVGRGEQMYDDAWCYDDRMAAVAAMHQWDGQGEPAGWMRHPASGRRRPGGDPDKEYVRP